MAPGLPSWHYSNPSNTAPLKHSWKHGQDSTMQLSRHRNASQSSASTDMVAKMSSPPQQYLPPASPHTPHTSASFYGPNSSPPTPYNVYTQGSVPTQFRGNNQSAQWSSPPMLISPSHGHQTPFNPVYPIHNPALLPTSNGALPGAHAGTMYMDHGQVGHPGVGSVPMERSKMPLYYRTQGNAAMQHTHFSQDPARYPTFPPHGANPPTYGSMQAAPPASFGNSPPQATTPAFMNPDSYYMTTTRYPQPLNPHEVGSGGFRAAYSHAPSTNPGLSQVYGHLPDTVNPIHTLERSAPTPLHAGKVSEMPNKKKRAFVDPPESERNKKICSGLTSKARDAVSQPIIDLTQDSPVAEGPRRAPRPNAQVRKITQRGRTKVIALTGPHQQKTHALPSSSKEPDATHCTERVETSASQPAQLQDANASAIPTVASQTPNSEAPATTKPEGSGVDSGGSNLKPIDQQPTQSDILTSSETQLFLQLSKELGYSAFDATAVQPDGKQWNPPISDQDTTTSNGKPTHSTPATMSVAPADSKGRNDSNAMPAAAASTVQPNFHDQSMVPASSTLSSGSQPPKPVKKKNNRVGKKAFQLPSNQSQDNTTAMMRPIRLTERDIEEYGIPHARGLAQTLQEYRAQQTRNNIAASFGHGSQSFEAVEQSEYSLSRHDIAQPGYVENLTASDSSVEHNPDLPQDPRFQADVGRGAAIVAPLPLHPELLASQEEQRNDELGRAIIGLDVPWSIYHPPSPVLGVVKQWRLDVHPFYPARWGGMQYEGPPPSLENLVQNPSEPPATCTGWGPWKDPFDRPFYENAAPEPLLVSCPLGQKSVHAINARGATSTHTKLNLMKKRLVETVFHETS